VAEKVTIRTSGALIPLSWDRSKELQRRLRERPGGGTAADALQLAVLRILAVFSWEQAEVARGAVEEWIADVGEEDDLVRLRDDLGR
jgi:hypothetical protein